MYIMYVDESGDTSTIQEGGSQFLVLTGCIISETDKKTVEQQLREIKVRYYQNPDIEIKSNFLRYANPDITDVSSPIKLHDREKYDALEKEIADFLKTANATLISVVVDKVAYWKQYPAQNPYESAYIFLLERFQQFLKEKEAYGICIIDPREGTVEKRYIDKELDATHNRLLWDSKGFWNQCPNIIERILFSNSDLTVGIQICDLYCYPVFHVMKYNKGRNDYWRFGEVAYPKMYSYTHMDGDRAVRMTDGRGLKIFPEASKKTLRLCQEGPF